ncbi:protein of unknown function (plasmid) [Cupriavidus taiwanensis]|uniref:Uncharacterized protein n=1 Tax=Cupriavidus taiwanensis TaxID=164546 RepID=A0A9Q7XU08_9BURK|nr:protein of unknown function [Cupriavidus taiwanensis]
MNPLSYAGQTSAAEREMAEKPKEATHDA